eukprot:3030620-Rhodomonas_salina.2
MKGSCPVRSLVVLVGVSLAVEGAVERLEPLGVALFVLMSLKVQSPLRSITFVHVEAAKKFAKGTDKIEIC